jgi:TRAP-type C4-dicarboxylate transport system permease small subunit
VNTGPSSGFHPVRAPMTTPNKMPQSIKSAVVWGFRSIRKALNGLIYILLAGMMLTTCIDVVGRYFFNKPLLGTFELVQMFMAILGGLTIWYAATTRGHINVDMFFERFSKRTQAIVSLVSSFLGCGLWFLVAFQVYAGGKELMASGQYSSTLHIPESPFVFMFALGLLFYCFTELIHAFGLLMPKKRKDFDKDES